MTSQPKLGSRELGLVIARYLLDVEDLHYGVWDADLELSLSNLALAQQRYTDQLLGVIEQLTAAISTPRILDVGCGTGHMLAQMLGRGWQVDAVNPSPALNRQVRQRLDGLQESGATTLLQMDFLAIPAEFDRQQYDLILFSESFQYITPLPDLMRRLPAQLKPEGQVVICDFFKTAAHGDGAPGDRSFSGGHILAEFYRLVSDGPFEIIRDEDMTSRVSPNIALIDDWLMRRLLPAAGAVNVWLDDNYPRRSQLVKWWLRRRLERLRYKYFSGHRSQAVFEKYKSYRLIVLRLSD